MQIDVERRINHRRNGKDRRAVVRFGDALGRRLGLDRRNRSFLSMLRIS